MTYANQSKGPVLSGLMIDNGPALLAAILSKAGFEPKIFDYSSVESVKRIAKLGKKLFLKKIVDKIDGYIKSDRSRIFGAKLYANGFKDSVYIASQIKKRNPELMVVAGGPQVSMFGHRIFGKITFDGTIFNGSNVFNALVYAEGDASIVGLAKVAYEGKNIENVPNLLLPDGRTTKRKDADLDQLPFPNYDIDVYSNIEDKMFIPVVEDSRGCHNACTFCIHPRIGGKLRERSIGKIIDEIKHTDERYGARIFRLSGPSPRAERVNELCKRLSEGYNISAFGYSSPDYEFTGYVPDKLSGVFIGVESTSEKFLKLYNKTEDADAFLYNVGTMIQGFKKADIATIVSMIVPSPDETRETMEKHIQYLSRVQPDFVVTSPIGFMPGTPLTRMAEKQGELLGVKLDEDFLDQMLNLELDLLQNPKERPPVPYQLRVDGEFTRDLFGVTAQFSRRLAEYGMFPNSDEIVDMAKLWHGSLSKCQNERRKQVNEFMVVGRQYITTSDSGGLRKMVDTINKNQGTIFTT